MANPPESNASSTPNESSDIEQEVRGDRNQVVGQAINSNVVNAGDHATIQLPPLPSHELDSSKHIPNNLPRSGALTFVGRESYISQLYERLQGNERIAITAIQGMGGIGKTELVLQYARITFSLKRYPGGVCWLRARDQEIATQIIGYAKANLGIKPPEDLETDEKVCFTWQRWPPGDALIIIDDVTDYDEIAPYLPPEDPRFKVLITTRNYLGVVTSIYIEELRDEDAVLLLTSFLGDKRIESQLGDAQALCKWVGNLPLGLELVGRYLMRKKDWAIAQLLERLESKRLDTKALTTCQSCMTANLGVAAALELSWTELSEHEQDLASLLGMFAVAPIPWNLIEQCFPDSDPDELEDLRDGGLGDRSLIKRVDEGTYQLHQVVQEFFREKLKAKGEVGQPLKSSFCGVMVGIAQSLDFTPTINQIEKVKGAIAHLEETANCWLESLTDREMTWPFAGVGRYYQGQGNYELAEPWYRKCLNSLRDRLGSVNLSIVSMLQILANLYVLQGRYKEAETHYLQSLEVGQKIPGEDHHEIADGLQHLAYLYMLQGRQSDAEPLYIQALEIYSKVFNKDHPNIASSLNNLAELYDDQGRYEEAEQLYLKALELRTQILGFEHPSVAQSLNNLGLLYKKQDRYEEAEQLYLQSLKLRQQLFGHEHLEVAQSFNNLAGLYRNQERYNEAETLYIKALELRKKLFGNDHPHVIQSLNNLAAFYQDQKRYQESETLYLQALDVSTKGLNRNDSDIACLLNNLALLYQTQGRYADAEIRYLQALKLWNNGLSNDHPDFVCTYFLLGDIYRQRGEFQAAKSLYLSALQFAEQILGNAHHLNQVIRHKLNTLPEGTKALPLNELGL